MDDRTTLRMQQLSMAPVPPAQPGYVTQQFAMPNTVSAAAMNLQMATPRGIPTLQTSMYAQMQTNMQPTPSAPTQQIRQSDLLDQRQSIRQSVQDRPRAPAKEEVDIELAKKISAIKIKERKELKNLENKYKRDQKKSVEKYQQQMDRVAPDSKHRENRPTELIEEIDWALNHETDLENGVECLKKCAIFYQGNYVLSATEQEKMDEFVRRVCDLYDAILTIRLPRQDDDDKKEFATCRLKTKCPCPICPSAAHDSSVFRDSRGGDKIHYCEPNATTKFCLTRYIIYLIVCELCGARYVGESKRCLKERYRSEKYYVSKVLEHFDEHYHRKQFYILQRIDESLLFANSGSDSLINFVESNPIKYLKGVEHIWIKTLITDPRLDLNTMGVKSDKVHKHNKDHVEWMKELLKNSFTEYLP